MPELDVDDVGDADAGGASASDDGDDDDDDDDDASDPDVDDDAAESDVTVMHRKLNEVVDQMAACPSSAYWYLHESDLPAPASAGTFGPTVVEGGLAWEAARKIAGPDAPLLVLSVGSDWAPAPAGMRRSGAESPWRECAIKNGDVVPCRFASSNLRVGDLFSGEIVEMRETRTCFLFVFSLLSLCFLPAFSLL